MNFTNVLAISKRVRLPRLASSAKRTHYSLSFARSAGELTSHLRTTRPDVVLFDSHMSGLTGRDLIARLLAQNPSVPILIIEDIDQLKPDMLVRVAELSQRTPAGSKTPGEKNLVGHALATLHHPASGRVDARRVASFFAIPLAELARILGRTPQSVHKTSDASTLQDKLSVLVRIATSLTTLFGSAENARVWLNAPNPDLDKARPIELIVKRKAEVVAELLEDALLGHPS